MASRDKMASRMDTVTGSMLPFELVPGTLLYNLPPADPGTRTVLCICLQAC